MFSCLEVQAKLGFARLGGGERRTLPVQLFNVDMSTLKINAIDRTDGRDNFKMDPSFTFADLAAGGSLALSMRCDASFPSGFHRLLDRQAIFAVRSNDSRSLLLLTVTASSPRM
jgi:hypothetical protein